MNDDPFVGTWRLADTDYETGEAPQEGTYTVKRNENDGYTITMVWVVANGQQVQAQYEVMPDGLRYAADDPQIADEIRMTRVDRLTLDSSAFKDGERVGYARRTLTDDLLTMRIEQTARTPDGREVTNTSIYMRVPDDRY